MCIVYCPQFLLLIIVEAFLISKNKIFPSCLSKMEFIYGKKLFKKQKNNYSIVLICVYYMKVLKDILDVQLRNV